MHSTKPGPIESKSSASARQAEKSQENFGISALTRCLVDADGNTSAGAGKARRKALGVSALIQFCTLTALLVVPLFATGTRLILRPTNFVPLPPYGGAPKHHAANSQQPTLPPVIRDRAPRLEYPQVQPPTQRPITIQQNLEEEPPAGANFSRNAGGLQGTGNGSNGDPNILNGFGDGNGPQPPRPEPAPVAPPRKPVAVSQGVQLALLTHRVEPIYPSFARQAHREGAVELRAVISADGAVKNIQVLSGDPMLALAARDAVAQWRFRPTLLNGGPVEVVTFITVNFHIGQ